MADSRKTQPQYTRYPQCDLRIAQGARMDADAWVDTSGTVEDGGFTAYHIVYTHPGKQPSQPRKRANPHA